MLGALAGGVRRCGPQRSPLPEIELAPTRPWRRALQIRLQAPALGAAHDAPAPDQGRARPQQQTPSLMTIWPRDEAPGEALVAATEAETYSVHLAVEQCPRRCVHWLDEKQTRACEEELQKAIDGLEMIDDTALRLEYMISAFSAENRLIERELRAAENRRERNRGAADNASWWK